MRRTLFGLGASFLLSVVAVSAAPAAAAAADERCTSLPEQIRSAMATADPAAAQRAKEHLLVGEQLCEARNKRGAAKQFRAAAKELGMSEQAGQVRTAAAR